jgi:hypothetical protein
MNPMSTAQWRLARSRGLSAVRVAADPETLVQDRESSKNAGPLIPGRPLAPGRHPKPFPICRLRSARRLLLRHERPEEKRN